MPDGATAGARRRPRVKICGVTTVDDARAAADAGADMIGLNFYPPSPRALETEAATTIAEALRASHPDVHVVGVFVNRPRHEVEAIDAAVGLDRLQFHGDEGLEDLEPFASRAIKVVRVRDDVSATAFEASGDVWGFLIDYRHPSLYGGSGHGWRFESLRQLTVGRPVLIAGGLDPDNIAAAVAAADPWGVDLCSGVEARPGRKDPELLRRLFEEIHHGQGALAS